MHTYEPIIFAALGGLAVQLTNLIELHKIPKTSWPDFKSFVSYWPYIIGPAVGALMGCCHFWNENDFNQPLLAIHIGASAPLLLRQMATLVPKA